MRRDGEQQRRHDGVNHRVERARLVQEHRHRPAQRDRSDQAEHESDEGGHETGGEDHPQHGGAIAPSAMRRPISRVRAVIDWCITPYAPIIDSISATPASASSSIVCSRRSATVRPSRCSTVTMP